MTENDSYMAMLNNKTINPPSHKKESTLNTKQDKTLKPATFPPVQQAHDLLVTASHGIHLVSESDEPFEFINTVTERDTLPTTVKDLKDLGLIDPEADDKLEIKSIQEFLQREEYQGIVKALEKLGELTQQGGKVYLVGERSITVLILSLVRYEQQCAIIGLRSLLVQT